MEHMVATVMVAAATMAAEMALAATTTATATLGAVQHAQIDWLLVAIICLPAIGGAVVWIGKAIIIAWLAGAVLDNKDQRRRRRRETE